MQERLTTAHRDRLDDRPVLATLAGLFVLVVALSWRKWGAPEIDAGAEMTTADLVKHGAVAYHDVRYYYGPLGLYSLALSFKLFGTSFTTVYAFGLVQAAAILAAFYALARHWLGASHSRPRDGRAARDRILGHRVQLHLAPHRFGHVRAARPLGDVDRAHSRTTAGGGRGSRARRAHSPRVRGRGRRRGRCLCAGDVARGRSSPGCARRVADRVARNRNPRRRVRLVCDAGGRVEARSPKTCGRSGSYRQAPRPSTAGRR